MPTEKEKLYEKKHQLMMELTKLKNNGGVPNAIKSLNKKITTVNNKLKNM